MPKGEFHPLAALHGRPKSQKALLSDLASLVWSAYQVLLVPSLRVSVPLMNSLIVEFIHVHESENKDLNGLDWNSIERTFMDEANAGGLLLGGQSLKFKTYDVSFKDCPLCTYAIAASTNSFTSRFLFENYTLIASEYLDSKRLHQILSDSVDELRKAAGIPEEDYSSHVLPVYVFDLEYNRLMMLDRYHQAIAFKDMVIAVRTKNTQTVSDYSCNGRLQYVGVSPTHLKWSPRHNNTLVDYTWSIGQTPFGPFSESSTLSFVQKDAAQEIAINLLESISAHGGDRKLLKQGRHVEFVQRWNMLKYKLDKVVSALSHMDFEKALYYYRSSDHDLFAIHNLVYHATEEMESSLVCFKDPPFPWGAVSIAGSVTFAFIYVYAKRDQIFKSKRKQF
ncbi:hypothetical protein MKW92_030761 [Papaver armeniacum]|nr:hypothetical protein MKW92_030761 [Papaver armeniacum]